MFFIYPMIFLTIICLFYLVYDDVCTREINIIPVLILSGIGFLYNLFFAIKYNFLKLYLLQLLVIIVFLAIIYSLGKITPYAYIGEGDLLVLLMIAFTTGYSLVFSEIVFLLSLFFMLFVPIIFLFYNLFKNSCKDVLFKKNFLILFLGFPISVSKLNCFYSVLEDYKIVNNKIKRTITLKPEYLTQKEIVTIKSLAQKHNFKKIWVSPFVPFVWPIFIAYIFLLFLLLLGKLNFLNNGILFFI